MTGGTIAEQMEGVVFNIGLHIYDGWNPERTAVT